MAARLEVRMRVLAVAQQVAWAGFWMALGFVVVATAVPQRRALGKLEDRLKEAQAREGMVLAERDNRRIELKALREDPAYLELHARDRLDYYREGERVLRFKREP